MAREITYNNFEISLVVFMPNITTNHAMLFATKKKIQLITTYRSEMQIY